MTYQIRITKKKHNGCSVSIFIDVGYSTPISDPDCSPFLALFVQRILTLKRAGIRLERKLIQLWCDRCLIVIAIGETHFSGASLQTQEAPQHCSTPSALSVISRTASRCLYCTVISCPDNVIFCFSLLSIFETNSSDTHSCQKVSQFFHRQFTNCSCQRILICFLTTGLTTS